MAITIKGKFILIYFLLVFSSSNPLVKSNSHEPETETETEPEPNQQQQLVLQRLEEIVRNLTEVVARLESKLSETKVVEGLVSPKQENEKHGGQKVQQGERARAVSVTKFSPFWSDRFQFVSAVKLDSQATCIHVLPFRDHEGGSKYVAVGDERGRVYVFLRNGDVVVEFDTLLGSPVMAMASFLSIYKNESFVVTGHKNGEILMHRVWEGVSGEEWSTVMMESVSKFDTGEDGLPVTILEVHHVGRMSYILASDVSGKITVYKENGTVHGSTMPSSRPLAFLKQRLLFLTETGAGSLDLRTMKIRESECEGLNHSLSRYYVFDAMERSKAYGFTSEGDLIHVLLLGDVMNFKCRVRSKKKFEMDEPLAFQAIKGCLLIVSGEKVFVYNVSSQHYVRVGAPRIIFSAGLDEIRSSFLNYQTMDVDAEKRNEIPLIASDREKLVVLGLGGGYVGMYRSNLPASKGEFSTMLWTSPVFFFVLFLFGAWQFFAKKKEALTSWGPDDPFSSTSATTGAPLGGNSTGERSFVDSSSRNADMMDIRGGGLRGPSRRYVSPPRYAGGATSSFRPGTTDHNPRPSSVDPNFRTTSELKFRGSALESSGFPKRRESLFVNNQVMDDSN
ncbi:putative membrane protein [Rosa sericea]